VGPEKTGQIQNDGLSVGAGMEVKLLGKVTGTPGERKFSMGFEGSSKQGRLLKMKFGTRSIGV